MTGALILSGAPTLSLQAATKAYVDTVAVAGGDASNVAITGGTINGVTIGGSTPGPGTFTTLVAGSYPDNNSFFAGSLAGNASITGVQNVGIGKNVLNLATTANSNTVIGANAGANMLTSQRSVGVGNQALNSATTASYQVGVGYYSLFSVDVPLASNAYNCAIGYQSAIGDYGATGVFTVFSTGTQNVCLGPKVMRFFTSASQNVLAGFAAGEFLTTGIGNCAYGYESLTNATTPNHNVSIGTQTLYSLITGSTNVAIGRYAGYGHNAVSNTIVIGGATTSTSSNQVVFSNTGKIGHALTNFNISGNLFCSTTVTTINNAIAVTITAAQLLGGYIIRTGGVAVSDVTPTAAQIVSAIPGCEVGASRVIEIKNLNLALLTILNGSGVTLDGNTTIAANFTRRYLVSVTNATASSEAVTLYGLGTQAI